MTDRELLELAAKAASIVITWADGYDYDPVLESGGAWNPLTDDGDALRLAVKLLLFSDNTIFLAQFGAKDPYADVRLAIVKAAAEIGKRRAA